MLFNRLKLLILGQLLNGNDDTSALAEAKARIEALQTQWMGIKSEMESEVTP